MSDQDWVVIAEYVQGVARAAFRRGFDEGWYFASKTPLDRDLQEEATRIYTASGFEPETVRQFHP